jgi:hypothetical protein
MSYELAKWLLPGLARFATMLIDMVEVDEKLVYGGANPTEVTEKVGTARQLNFAAVLSWLLLSSCESSCPFIAFQLPVLTGVRPDDVTLHADGVGCRLSVGLGNQN